MLNGRRKLKLDRETVRVLTSDDLIRIQGGTKTHLDDDVHIPDTQSTNLPVSETPRCEASGNCSG